LKAFVHVAWGLRCLPWGGARRPQAGECNRGGGVYKVTDLASARRLLSRISGSGAGVCASGFCAPGQEGLRLGADAGGRGFEDWVDVYQLANLALDLIGAETVDGSRRWWRRARREAP
jgi:hypothetical protein